MKIVVYTTSNYPYYDKKVINGLSMEEAEKKANEISREIVRKINCGELQDGQVEVLYSNHD